MKPHSIHVISAKDARLSVIEIAEFIETWEYLFDPPFSERVRGRSSENSIRDYSRKLLRRGEVVVYLKDAEIVGLIGFYCNDTLSREAYISILLVARDQSGLGIGSALIEACIDKVEAYGFESIALKTWTNNESAVGLYTKHGFRVVLNQQGDLTLIKKLQA